MLVIYASSPNFFKRTKHELLTNDAQGYLLDNKETHGESVHETYCNCKS